MKHPKGYRIMWHADGCVMEEQAFFTDINKAIEYFKEHTIDEIGNISEKQEDGYLSIVDGEDNVLR